jgi:membrane-bound PQQ-dependent dehydrogenase (glucose/quinate/shikimate family)
MTASPAGQEGGLSRVIRIVLAILIGLFGIAMAVGGVRLLQLGGSSYYGLAGLLLVGGAVLLWRKAARARLPFDCFLAGTILWAWWEMGGEAWGMGARIGFPLLIWVAAWLQTGHHPWSGRRILAAASGLAAAAIVVTIGLSWDRSASSAPDAAQPQVPLTADAQDWPHYGRTLGGSRFSPLTQITPANVAKLTPAWSYRTGDMPGKLDTSMEFTFEATPIKIADTLYLCTPHNIVIALDAETGHEKWRFDPHVQHGSSYLKACRGVSYYKAAVAVPDCPERIIAATIDARMFALDARTGRLCPSFGSKGMISVLTGFGDAPPGLAYITSPPIVVAGKAVVGGWVLDGFSVGEPSGAVRAYDAVTGKFAWAWDLGRPGQYGMPPPGERFTPGTPNVWAPMSADETLGLIYMPTGNSTPDHWGAHRSALSEHFASSIVAVEAATGHPRWSFQTVHHDLWDFDVPANPVLFDLKRNGSSTPALAQVTKSGQIFVLDRRTGRPLIPVTERPMPQGAAKGDWLSPTQPISAVPSIGPPRLTEAAMWGITPLDQLWCRISFRSNWHEGLYTPPSERGTLMYPGPYGTSDWGGVTVDEDRGLLIANSSWLPFLTRLIPRADAEPLLAEQARSRKDPAHGEGIAAQKGTPFAMGGRPMLSLLGVPCNAPPWGHLQAIDLGANRMVWTKTLGTIRDNGPFGLPFPPVKTGGFSMGGPTATRGGVTFIGATIDNVFRGYDSRTGRLLWSARLPAGGQASPMTYWSTKSGRQFVVIAAGGHGALRTRYGDYVMAYALPAGVK